MTIMGEIIKVAVRNRIATADTNIVYICGNSDYVIEFNFDEEWNAHEYKTARFTYGGMHQDMVFSGNTCPVPIISDTHSFKVGVFAGNLKTTTAAYIPAKKSILCDAGQPAPPTNDVYAQIMEKLNSMSGGDVSPEEIKDAVNAYMMEHPVKETDPSVSDWAKQSKKPTYTSKEVGAADAQETEEALNTLSVEIASQAKALEDKANKEAPYDLIETITIEEAGITRITRTQTPAGQSLAMKKVLLKMTSEATLTENLAYAVTYGLSNGARLYDYIANAIRKTYATAFHSRAEVGADGTRSIISIVGSKAEETVPSSNIRAYRTVSGEQNLQITSVDLSGPEIPVGTEIEIWGVWANAEN